MIEGEVENREAVVSLTVLGPGGYITIAAVVGTGFTGDLTLPTDIVQQLGLVSLMTERVRLPTGELPTYRASTPTFFGTRNKGVWPSSRRGTLPLSE